MTILGILSDSHGRAETTAAAVRRLLDSGANLFLHLGDLCSEEVIDELVGRNARIVFGNCDWDLSSLASYAESVGVAVDHPTGALSVDGKAVVYTHGHIESEMRSALDACPNYLLHGHSHEVRDERIGPTRVINPGALFRARRYTAAVLEPASDHLEFIEIPR